MTVLVNEVMHTWLVTCRREPGRNDLMNLSMTTGRWNRGLGMLGRTMQLAVTLAWLPVATGWDWWNVGGSKDLENSIIKASFVVDRNGWTSKMIFLYSQTSIRAPPLGVS